LFVLFDVVHPSRTIQLGDANEPAALGGAVLLFAVTNLASVRAQTRTPLSERLSLAVSLSALRDQRR
jgi:hypothetical protein